MRTVAKLAALAAFAACGTSRAIDLVPIVLVEANHASNIAQHMGEHPTNYGYSTVSGFLHWEAGRMYLDVGEGQVVGGGSLHGMRQITQARVGVKLDLFHWGHK